MDSENPYQAPKTIAEPAIINTGILNDVEEKKFRQQIVALGGFWIFIGTISLIMGLVTGFGSGVLENESFGVFVFFSAIALVWLTIGIFACARNIGAVWAGLILSYISLLGTLPSLNVCGAIILAMVIAQAHRVISWSKRRQVA